MENEEKTGSREWELDAENEYRFELDPGTSLAIKVRQRNYSVLLQGLNFFQLVSGQAEVFGTELAEGKQYLFGSECKASVFTWQGCVLEISLIQYQNNLMFDAYLTCRCTSQAIPLLNMSQTKHRWPHMQIYISRSSKCASVH
jgi:N-terminal beta-sandwich domain of polyadenylation factor